MSYQVSIKSAALALGIMAIANVAPAQAASITSFSNPPFSGTGSITPALSGSPSTVTLSTGTGATDATESALQNFLGVASEGLDTNVESQAFEGSALKLTVAAGDVLNFNWNFSLQTGDLDRAFTVFNGVVTPFAGTAGVFNQTFSSGGTFGVGVVDIGDTSGDSSLQLSNLTYTPVPTPAILPGLIGFGLTVMRKRRQQMEA